MSAGGGVAGRRHGHSPRHGRGRNGIGDVGGSAVAGEGPFGEPAGRSGRRRGRRRGGGATGAGGGAADSGRGAGQILAGRRVGAGTPRLLADRGRAGPLRRLGVRRADADAGAGRRRLGLRAVGRDPRPRGRAAHPRPLGRHPDLPGAVGRPLRGGLRAVVRRAAPGDGRPGAAGRVGLLRALPRAGGHARAERAGGGGLSLQPAGLRPRLHLHERPLLRHAADRQHLALRARAAARPGGRARRSPARRWPGWRSWCGSRAR